MTSHTETSDSRPSARTYRTYGLTVRSVFDLPELPALESGGDADVSIERGAVDPVPESVEGRGGRRVAATVDEVRLSYDSIGSFLVTDGERVVFDPVSPDVAGRKLVRRLFENEMLGVLLHQRGRLVLHASAVAIDGRAAVFLGPRGVGKSTTAAAFHTRGRPILEDDIVSIRFDGDAPVVDPGVPEMRLRPDAVEALGIGGTRQYDGDGGSGKRYLRLGDRPESVPLGCCYVVLEGNGVTIDSLSEREGLLRLIDQTYTQGMLKDTSAVAAHFEQCSTVVETTPFGALRRPDNHEALPTVVSAVVDDCSSGDDRR